MSNLAEQTRLGIVSDTMLDEYGFEVYEENAFPLAYLLTFRTYGTWLHGDERHSVDRDKNHIYGTPDIPPKPNLEKAMRKDLVGEFTLNTAQRKVVKEVVEEVCAHRGYFLHAVNARTNHVHAVVSAQVKPEGIVDAFKAYSTRRLKEERLISDAQRVWSRGRSRKYLWKPRHLERAIDYVLFQQGDAPFELD